MRLLANFGEVGVRTDLSRGRERLSWRDRTKLRLLGSFTKSGQEPECGPVLNECGPEPPLILNPCGPEGGDVFGPGRLCFQVAILSPLEVKRQLATLEAASARAIELARQIITRRCYRAPDLDALQCSVEVTMFDLRPFADVAWIQDDGTQVLLTEAEQPLPSDWAWRG